MNIWIERARAVKAWAEANPELAAAWDAAWEEDEERDKVAAEKRWRLEFQASIVPSLRAMGVPLRTAEALAGGELETPGLEAARKWLASTESLWTLFGGVGSGKTCAAAWTLLQARAWKEGHLALSPAKGTFILAPALFQIGRFDNDLWHPLLKVPWLVVDDLGVESVGDYAQERLGELIDVRYGNRLRTVLTSNLSADDFKARYGQRIASRVRDGLVTNCGSEDLRGKERHAR